MIFETQEQLDERLAYWQKVLRLQDWDVKVRIVRSDAMHSRENMGECWGQAGKQQARINLMDPIDYDSDTFLWPLDHDAVLVHELLHLHVNKVMDEVRDVDEALGTRLQTQEESIVNCIQSALITLDRNGRA